MRSTGISPRSAQVAQRMRPFEPWPQVRIDQVPTDLTQGSWLPTRALVFVDQQRAHALGKIVMDTAADRRLVFQAEDVREREMERPALQLEGERRRGRRALRERGARLRQPRIGIARQ